MMLASFSHWRNRGNPTFPSLPFPFLSSNHRQRSRVLLDETPVGGFSGEVFAHTPWPDSAMIVRSRLIIFLPPPLCKGRRCPFTQWRMYLPPSKPRPSTRVVSILLSLGIVRRVLPPFPPFLNDRIRVLLRRKDSCYSRIEGLSSPSLSPPFLKDAGGMKDPAVRNKMSLLLRGRDPPPSFLLFPSFSKRRKGHD